MLIRKESHTKETAEIILEMKYPVNDESVFPVFEGKILLRRIFFCVEYLFWHWIILKSLHLTLWSSSWSKSWSLFWSFSFYFSSLFFVITIMIINFFTHNIISHSVGVHVVFNIVLQCNTVINISDCILFLFSL